MKLFSRSNVTLAACLSALAGYIDAIGFIHLGGYFVSFMSGNTTRLAVALQSGDFTAVAALVGIIVCFVFGAMLGALIGHFAGPRRRSFVLFSVAALLAAAAALYGSPIHSLSIGLMAIAMGTENAVFQRDGEVAIGLTYMTGTLVRIGQKIAAALLGGERFAFVPHLFLWLGLLAGGFTGAAVYELIGLRGLWGAAFAALCLALLLLNHRHEDSLKSR